MTAEPKHLAVGSESREPWWTWHWDYKDVAVDRQLPCKRIRHWRRGFFLSVYRVEFDKGGVQWWFYGPFNIAIAFGKG